MSYVVAFIGQDSYQLFPSREHAPEGSVVFTSPEELAKVATASALDQIRKTLLGQSIGKSRSADEAARRLWYLLTLDAPPTNWSIPKRKDFFGNQKIASTRKIELMQLIYVPGKHPMVDFHFKKLPRQARQVVQMLIDDGRGIWTGDEANAVIAARAGEVQSKQGAISIFNYYRSELFAKKILKRVSFSDFITYPEMVNKPLYKLN